MSQQNETASPTGTSESPTLTGTTASNSDFVSLFECPVCYEYVLPPILQCQSGHLVCHSCRPKLTHCPTCRGPLESIRNLMMEKVASSILFPCKYTSFGCHLKLPYTEKENHEEMCEFKPCSCPCPGNFCKWQGALSSVLAHLTNKHNVISTLKGEDVVFLATNIELPGYVDWVMLQDCFDLHFMIVMGKRENDDGHQHFFVIVQLIGTREQAATFAYRLQLNGNRRQLTWEATPQSIYDGIETAIRKGDCLVFNSNTAELFIDDGNIGVNVSITRY